MVNLDRITEYVRSDGGHLVLEGKVTVSISPDRVDELMKRLG
jgi:hypothetical protein